MINLSNAERETLWLDIFQKELFLLLNEESEESTVHIYLHSIIYNNTIGGRHINKCIISIDNLLS